MRADWAIEGRWLRIVLRAQTSGWVAVALGDGPTLPGSRVFLARVVDGRPEVQEHVATANGHHRVRASLRDVAGRERPSETAGHAETVVSFAVPVEAHGGAGSGLRAGARRHVWLAWSPTDDFARHSRRRRHFEAAL